MLLDEKVCLPLNNILKKEKKFLHLKSGKHRLLHLSHFICYFLQTSEPSRINIYNAIIPSTNKDFDDQISINIAGF